MTRVFTEGQNVTVTIRNPLWYRNEAYAVNAAPSEFLEFTGSVVYDKTHKGTLFGLTTGIKSFPVRTLDLNDVVGHEQPKVSSAAPTSWIVEGSKGNKYTVSRSGNRLTCTCPGFSFRHDCKHIKQ